MLSDLAPLAPTLGWMLAALFGALWFAERDRRKAAEKSGRYRPRAVHKPRDSAEDRARSKVREAERRVVHDLTAQLRQEAKNAGQKFSDRELEEEARRLLREKGL